MRSKPDGHIPPEQLHERRVYPLSTGEAGGWNRQCLRAGFLTGNNITEKSKENLKEKKNQITLTHNILKNHWKVLDICNCNF